MRENLESTAPASGQSFSTLRRGKVPKPERQKVNLMVNVQAFMCPVGEPADVRLTRTLITNTVLTWRAYAQDRRTSRDPSHIEH